MDDVQSAWLREVIWESHGGLSAGLMAKARGAIVNDLAAVLAYQMQQEFIPVIAASYEQRGRDLAAAEAEQAKQHGAWLEDGKVVDKLEAAYRKAFERDPKGKVAYDAEHAWLVAAGRHDTRGRRLEAARIENNRERQNLDQAPDNLARLRSVAEPSTPYLDRVLATLGQRV